MNNLQHPHAWQSPNLPVWASLILLFVGLPLVFMPATNYPFEPPKVFLLRLVVIALGTVATFYLSSQGWQRFTRRLRGSPLLLLGGLYSTALLAASFTAANVPLSLWGTPLDHHGAVTTLCCIVVGLALVVVVPTAVQGQKLLRWLVLGSVPICLYGLVQVVGMDPLAWETDSVSPLLSTLGRSNFVAAYLAILLPLTLYLAQRLPWRHTWPIWCILLLQTITLLWTQTRAGWLAGAAGIVVVLLGQLPRHRFTHGSVRLLGAIGLVTLLAVAGFQQLREATTPPPLAAVSYQELRTISVERRLQIWQETWRLVPAAGWLGYGPEHFLPVFSQSVDVPTLFDGVNAIVNDPHNLLLDQLMAVGLGGTAVFLTILIAFYWLGMKRGGRFRWALLGSMTAFLVQAMFTPDVVPTTLLFWTLVGLLAASQEWPHAQATHAAPSWQRPQIVWPRLAISKKQLGLLLGGAVLGMGLFWRSYHLSEWLRFTGDETRDLFAAFQITQGTAFPSHGPKVHIGFGYLGPAYYYLLALPLWLLQGAPIAAGWLTVLFDVGAIGLVYLVGKRLFNATTGWIAALLYAFSFQVIFYARWGWHPSLVPFFTLLIIYGCLRLAAGETRWFPTVMLAFSLALQLHLTAVLLIIPILFGVWQQRRQISLPLFGFALVVGLYPFIPLLTFEITEGYPNVRGLLSLAAFQGSEVWTSPVAYLLNSLGTISTGAIIHKSVDLVGNGRFFTTFNGALTLAGLLALWRRPLPQGVRAIFASWVIVPPLALAVFSGFRPDYYLITWFAVPLLLVAHFIGSVWANGRFRILAPLLLLLILGLNLNTLSAYYRFMEDRDQQYAHFYGNTLAHKEAIVDRIATHAGDDPYALQIVTWAWPNHQPYAYLLMDQPNKPSNIWLYEYMAEEAVYQEHWLDMREYFAASGETAVATYIITEPDSLPLPAAWQEAEKIGSFGGTGVYRFEGNP